MQNAYFTITLPVRHDDLQDVDADRENDSSRQQPHAENDGLYAHSAVLCLEGAGRFVRSPVLVHVVDEAALLGSAVAGIHRHFYTFHLHYFITAIERRYLSICE